MYVNDSPRAEIKVFEVADDGTLVNGRVLAEGHRWRHDRRGLARRDGVRRVRQRVGHRARAACGCSTRSGERIGMIATPEVCGSLCWGGPDLRTLFLTTSTTVHTMPDAVHLGAAAALRRWEAHRR